MLLLWKWWNVRNKINKGEKGLSGDEVAAEVTKLFGEQSAHEQQQLTRRKEGTPRWKHPPQG